MNSRSLANDRNQVSLTRDCIVNRHDQNATAVNGQRVETTSSMGTEDTEQQATVTSPLSTSSASSTVN